MDLASPAVSGTSVYANGLMMQLSTSSVTLCSLNVVVKNKMGGHEARMAKMGITEGEETTSNSHVYLKGCGGRKWTGFRWLTVEAGFSKRHNEASCFTIGGEILYVGNYQLL